MESWTSYPKIWNVGHAAVATMFDHPVLVEEKVDGSQFSFGRFDTPDGPMSSKDLFEGARLAGVSRNAIFGAKKAVGVDVSKRGMDGGWWWSLLDSSYTWDR